VTHSFGGELTPTEPASPYEPTAPLVDPAMPPQQDANPSPPVASSSATSPPQDAAPKAAAAPKQAPRKQVLICLGDYPTHLDMNSHPGSVGSPRKQRRRHPKAVTKRQEIFEFANSSSSSGANPSKKRVREEEGEEGEGEDGAKRRHYDKMRGTT